MNYFNKNKTISVIVILLLIINVTALVTIFFQRHAPGFPPKPSDKEEVERTTQFLKNELQFSDAQVETFMVLQDKYLNENEEYRKNIGDAKVELYGRLLEENIEIQKDELLKIIGVNTTLIEQNTYAYFQKLKDLCTEEQQEKFDMLMGQILMKINPNHRPPGDRNGPPPPPHGEENGQRPMPPHPPRKK